MSLSEEERQKLVAYRLLKARRTLEDARKVIELKMWATAANRLYYATYYAVSALLITNGYIAKSHEGIIRLFNQHFIATGMIDKQLGRQYNKLFTLRLTGDYGDCFDLEEEDVSPLLKPADDLIEKVSEMIQ